MFDIGGGELILILLAILVLFGPKKIPEIAQMIGRGVQQVKKAQSQFESQMSDIRDDMHSATEPKPKKIDNKQLEDESKQADDAEIAPPKDKDETENTTPDSQAHGFRPRKPSQSIENKSDSQSDRDNNE
jgi:TatA/E family protein of Tat protein translocase